MTLAVGYDGGDSAQHALRVAIDLARDLGENLLLVCAVAPPGTVGEEYTAVESALVEALSPELVAGVEQARAAGVEAEPILIDADPVGALETVMTTRSPRLLVIGYGSAGRIQAALFGAVAPQMIERSAIPVLVVP
ncbi:MAG TPA: universal stress protein [Actinobacteria bacterium]|jgi:nucleotide-binding universal stress UspA family protein|nr:universal stress protein [Actinomycetota bacterium]